MSHSSKTCSVGGDGVSSLRDIVRVEFILIEVKAKRRLLRIMHAH